jgi:hypothetical protein
MGDQNDESESSALAEKVDELEQQIEHLHHRVDRMVEALEETSSLQETPVGPGVRRAIKRARRRAA